MGLLDRLFGGMDRIAERQQAQAIAPSFQAYGATFHDLTDPRLAVFLRGGRSTATGKTVTEGSALRNAPFFRSINLVSGCIGMLPTNLHRKDDAGNIEKASDHHVQKLLRVKPNGYQTPLQFKAYMQGRALLQGDGYAYKVPGGRGGRETIALIPLDPLRVSTELTDDWTLIHKWTRKDGSVRELTQDQVLHLRAPYSSDGITGDALLDVAAEVLGLADAADEAAARLLKNGSYVGGALTHPKNLSQEAIIKLKGQFEERYSGPENAGKWLVLEEDMKAQPFGMTGRDAEGLAQRKHQAEEVSRFTGVPRPLLMFDETSWGTGIEQLGLFLITYCLMPWFVAWEEVIAMSLLTEEERDAGYYAKFNEAALLRGSLKDQAEFLSKALGGPGATGYLMPNEARELMERNPRPGGDEPNWGVAPNGGSNEAP